MPRLLFVNLPVTDPARSREFFGKLGFTFDEKFSSEDCACMEVNDQGWVMLLRHGRFSDFTSRPIADARLETPHILALSAESREAVDSLTDLALGSGATDGGDPQDYGFMYQRSFHDPDGHLWEVMWMDPAAVEQGPPDMAETA